MLLQTAHRHPLTLAAHGLASLLLALGCLAGCGPQSETPLQEYGRLENRLVAWAPDMVGCPIPDADADRWVVRPVFSGDGTGADRFMGRGPGRLCEYQWLGEQAEAPGVLRERLPAGLRNVEHVTDFTLVVPLGNPDEIEALADSIRGGLHAHSLAQLGFEPGVTTQATVRVAVFDTALPNPAKPGMPGSGRSPHGRDMALLIRKLACPDNSPVGNGCPVHVDTHLALNLIPDENGSWKEDNVAGGFFGQPLHLAKLINNAVKDWQDKHPEDHFIINLSVGWEPGDPNDTGVLAVKAALLSARGHGAAIFAAAGNDKDGPVASDDAMEPGAWEVEPGGILPPYSGEPLVFSVGGVTSAGVPLANTRHNGRPPLAAYSYQVAFDDSYLTAGTTGPGFSSPALTGTSISAAVASGLAAVAWSNEPKKTAMEIWALLYESGRKISPAADYCFGGPCPEIHELWMCGLLQRLGQVASCVQPGTTDPIWSRKQVDWAGKISNLVSMPQMIDWEPLDCGPDTIMHHAPGGAVEPCPDYTHLNYQPEPQLEPQPSVPICTTCQIKKALYKEDGKAMGAAYLLTAPSPLPKTAGQVGLGDPGRWLYARLRLNHSTGLTDYVDLGGPYGPGEAVIIQNLPLLESESIETAELTVVVEGFLGTFKVKSEQIPLSP